MQQKDIGLDNTLRALCVGSKAIYDRVAFVRKKQRCLKRLRLYMFIMLMLTFCVCPSIIRGFMLLFLVSKPVTDIFSWLSEQLSNGCTSKADYDKKFNIIVHKDVLICLDYQLDEENMCLIVKSNNKYYIIALKEEWYEKVIHEYNSCNNGWLSLPYTCIESIYLEGDVMHVPIIDSYLCYTMLYFDAIVDMYFE